MSLAEMLPGAKARTPGRRPSAPRASFVWQAALIILPVVILTVLGLLSLRQDRLLAEQAARERAGRLAREVADRVFGMLFESDPAPPTNRTTVSPGIDLDRPVFEITPQLELAWPRPMESPPRPRPLDPTELSEPSRAAWESARRATLDGDAAVVSRSWADFLASEPPAEFAACAQFEWAQTAVRAGQTNEAADRFEQLAAAFPDATLESGLPVAPLAAWKAAELRLALATNSTDRITAVLRACSNLVFQPSALTPDLLDRLEELTSHPRDQGLLPAQREDGGSDLRVWRGRASILAWRQLWETTEISRGLFGAARYAWQTRGLIRATEAGGIEFSTRTAAPIWVDLPVPESSSTPNPGCVSSVWLLTRFPPDSLRFHGWTECQVTNLLARARSQLAEWPSYFGLVVSIAGRALPAPSTLPLLAERAAGGPVAPGLEGPAVSAAVYLADAPALYAHQRQRTWWFVAVVLAAAATAGIGLLAAHRAFRRQLRLSEMKSNFVSSVSHELRAPIASVRLLAESLDRGRITEETKRREYFRLIGQECRRLSALVENVLDFSRIDQGRKQYEFEPTDLPALVTQTVKLMQPYAAERQVALEALLPAALGAQPTLDGKAIQQALVNLIDNAVKHAPAGTVVSVALSCPAPPQPGRNATPDAPAVASPAADPAARSTDDGSRLALSVTDEGPGIPAAEHARIFEPFYRRGSELRRETSGVGIGLTIVKHVVDAHGGAVRVESELGKGSRFVIELPVCHAS
ncbi:MAG TPA: HAMP domain-containing sensor histidine kinase [Verrucomicrobiota bacterium]|nr:HAMP domain-containing sensor histidine kinase [Verrucomicrobiota bacterium]HRZ36522.1 HAMP domain-containing sensor histidine kinase [Candidatus Paceibacterota bacterium]HRZ54051.1 HAMP domain-containing sensor histidine kinase [Candidatus Paceibacterota bacterium]